MAAMLLLYSTPKRSVTPCLLVIIVIKPISHTVSCHPLNQDGEGGEEDTKFDPGYEPDWAVISTVKKDREHVPVKESGLVYTADSLFNQLG